MPICAEELPVEIWLIIFQYLEAHDLFHAFHNLNYYFNKILASNHLLFYVRLKEIDNTHPEYSTESSWFDSILNRIICLRPVVRSQSSYFVQFLRSHANKLIRLQSLSIKLCSGYTPFIAQPLKQLHSLEHLSLTCTSDPALIESILCIPSLRKCQLTLRESTLTINHNLNLNSNLKQFFIIFLDNINYLLIENILIYTSKLKRLEISGSYFSFEQVTILAKQIFILPQLKTFKLKLENGYFVSDCFKYLHTTMPVLKHFYFNFNRHILSEAFLEYFTLNWWTFIEQIQFINIYIKGHLPIDTNNSNAQVNLQKYKEILFAKSKRSNKSFKVEWNEQVFIVLKLIEISIVKS